MPWASRREGRTAMSRSAVMALMSSRRPVKMIRSRAGAGSVVCLGLQRRAERALAHDRQPGARRPLHDGRHGGDEVLVPLLRLQAGHDPQQHVRAGDAALVAQAARRGGKGETCEVHAVGNNAERRQPSLAADLLRNGLRGNQQVVHERRELGQGLHVLRGADPRGVDGGHHHRGAGRNGGPGANHLGAVHVGVDQVDLVAAQVGGQLADGGLVICLVDDVDLHPQLVQTLHRGSPREGERAHVVPGTVQAQEQPAVALLGSPGPARGQQLQDARAQVPAGAVRAPMAAVLRPGYGALVVGGCRGGCASCAARAGLRAQALPAGAGHVRGAGRDSCIVTYRSVRLGGVSVKAGPSGAAAARDRRGVRATVT